MITQQLTDDCLTYIRTGSHITFTEIENWLRQQGINPDGDQEIYFDLNVILWCGMSEDFVDLIRSIQPHTVPTPTNILTYVADGGKIPGYPLAKRPPRDGYREPHWLPVTLNAGD